MLNSSSIGLLVVVGLVVIWIRRWRNPKCNGVLPPGSMGFPLIGETLSLIVPSYSLDLHSFLKTRFQRYGPIFRTSIAGQAVAVSADPEFNRFLFQQEGKLVEFWYLDSFGKLLINEGEFRINSVGDIHKYVRARLLSHFGAESLKGKLLPQIEEMINKTLSSWSTKPSVEVKHASADLVLDFSVRQVISNDAEEYVASLSETYAILGKCLASFPLNIPGTIFHQCLKGQRKITSMLKRLIKERRMQPETYRGDILDHIIKDMETEKFLSEDFVVQLIFGILFAAYESVSTIVALAFKLLSDHPSVMEEMIAEQEAILNNRKDVDSSLTWDEYKSMTFTLQVITEALRLANTAPGMLRRTLEDIPVKGFTIPKGWTIMMVSSAQHLSPDIFNNALEFNPSRWKELDSSVISKNFMPFGAGSRQCAGAEYSRVFLATFFHVLLTKYRWIKVKEGKIGRFPMLGFRGGIHVKFSEK